MMARVTVAQREAARPEGLEPPTSRVERTCLGLSHTVSSSFVTQDDPSVCVSLHIKAFRGPLLSRCCQRASRVPLCRTSVIHAREVASLLLRLADQADTLA